VPGYPADCQASQVVADFDGDGQHDAATIAKSRCFHHPGQQPSFATEFNMAVSWGGGAGGVVAMEDCERACVAFRAADLNGDGAAELWVIVDEDASSQTLEVFALPQSEAFGRAATVAEPGANGFPAGQSAGFRFGGSVKHYAALGCTAAESEVIAESADATGNEGGYTVRRTVLRFDPIDTRPFAHFTVVSTSDEVVHLEPGVLPGDAFEPGDPCWIEPAPGG
jgi:hypothetical protein